MFFLYINDFFFFFNFIFPLDDLKYLKLCSTEIKHNCNNGNQTMFVKQTAQIFQVKPDMLKKCILKVTA